MRRDVRVVAFSGVDGAGKSSQVLRLSERLADAGLEPVIFWMPLGHNPIQRRLSRLARRALRAPHRSGAGRDTRGDRAKALRARRPIVTSLWALVVATSYALTYRRVVARAGRQSEGAVVLFDRYALDAIAQMRYYYGDRAGYQLPRLLLRRISPRPDHAYLLDVDAETALARKQEQHSLTQLREQVQLLRDEARALGVEVLAGDASAELLADRIAGEVLQPVQTTSS